MPTTVVKTIRASGGDYTTLSAWEAAQQGDLVTADEIRVAECYNDWPSGLNDSVVIDGWTLDASHYVKITVAPGHRHSGVPGAGFRLVKDLAWNGLIRLAAGYQHVIVEHVESVNPPFNGFGFEVQKGTFVNCIARGPASGFFSIQSGAKLINCLAHGQTYAADYGAFQIINWSGPVLLGCVAANSARGFATNASAASALKNCISYNNTTNYLGTFSAASTNNATSSATDDAPGGSSVVGITSAAFVNAAGNDFHLAPGSVLIGAGTNLYADFQADIDGDAWPSAGAWDIGFDYYVSSGGAANLSPSLLTNSQVFYSPAVTPGAVSLAPSLFSNTSTFHAAAVTQGGAPQELTPALLANAQTFYSPAVTAGSVTIAPALLANAQIFYSPDVTAGGVSLQPGLLSNAQIFHAPTVVQEDGPQYLTPGLLTNAQTFHAATVSVGGVSVAPGLLTNAQTFYAPTVTQGFASQELAPALFGNSQTFHAPIVTPGGVVLAPEIVVNLQTFYAVVLSGADLLKLPTAIYSIAAESRIYSIAAESRIKPRQTS